MFQLTLSSKMILYLPSAVDQGINMIEREVAVGGAARSYAI